MISMKLLNVFLLIALICTHSFAQSEDELNTLLSWMEGSFSSEEQAQNDSDYFNISLEMKRIWGERNDGYWLYVEQAAAETKDKPYRQRIYNLTKVDKSIISIIFSLPNEQEYIGGYKNPELFNKLSPDSLLKRDGCEVLINRLDEYTFLGSTIDDNCPSNLRGAAYATTEVMITKDKMISWDRGSDNKGVQVWGAVKGGYIFKKISTE